MKALGESIPGYKIRDIIKEVDINENGTVEFTEFLEVSDQFSVEYRKWKLEYVHLVAMKYQSLLYLPKCYTSNQRSNGLGVITSATYFACKFTSYR